MSYGPTLLVGHDATGLCWLVYNLHRPVHLSPQVRLWLPTASHRRHFHQGFPALMFGDCFLRGPGPTRSEGMHAQDRENPGLPTEARGGMVELRGHVSNSCRLAITFCWWLWQREARSFPLIHEQNQKAPCKGGQIIGFAIEYHCPAWSPRGEAQPPISFKRDEDRT